jgi:hypothetical protein
MQSYNLEGSCTKPSVIGYSMQAENHINDFSCTGARATQKPRIKVCPIIIDLRINAEA